MFCITNLVILIIILPYLSINGFNISLFKNSIDQKTYSKINYSHPIVDNKFFHIDSSYYRGNREINKLGNTKIFFTNYLEYLWYCFLIVFCMLIDFFQRN